MDKLERYRKLVKGLVEKYGEMAMRSNEERSEIIVINDDKTDNYLWLHLSSLNGERHFVPLHLRLKNEKIFVCWDGTNLEFAQQLIDAGVPEEDIVIGFHQPDFSEHLDLENAA
jgi:hypothetical protein